MDALTGKIAKASINVGAFLADKRNNDQNYAYISADAVLTRAGDALAKAGVALYPEVTAIDVKVVERQGKSPRIDATVTFSMHLSDGEGERAVQWVGLGSDYAAPDKALYKAITSGHKYFLMKLLCIGVGNEDSEHEGGDPEPPRKAEKKSAPERTPEVKEPEPQTPEHRAEVRAASDAQVLRAEFARKFNEATRAGIKKGLPTITGKSTAEEILMAMQQIDSMTQEVA